MRPPAVRLPRKGQRRHSPGTRSVQSIVLPARPPARSRRHRRDQPPEVGAPAGRRAGSGVGRRKHCTHDAAFLSSIPTWSEPSAAHRASASIRHATTFGPQQRRPGTRTRTRPPTGASQQIGEGTEGSGSHESRRRSRRRTRSSPGWRRQPAIGTHQEPARRQHQHGQPQGCADHLRLREASDGPRIAVASRSGAGYQGQATTRRCANDDLHRTLTVLMCRSSP
jgi:hypothetical protein